MSASGFLNPRLLGDPAVATWAGIMTEKRRETRKRTFLKGRILFNNGASSMDCLVRDISPGGARLALDEALALPDAFELEIPNRDRSFTAVMKWRREDGMGVTIEEQDEGQPTRGRVARLLRRVSELEAENRALRVQLGCGDEVVSRPAER